MPENKSLGEIAFEGSGLGDHIGTPYKTLLPFSKCNWEAAAQAVRKAVIEECIQAIKGCMPFMIENDANGDGYREALAAAEQALRSIANEGKTDG